MGVVLLPALLIFAVGEAGGVSLNAWSTITLINLVFVVSLYVFVGNSGVMSFGHMGFAMLGAYTSAILTMDPLTKGILLPGLPEPLIKAELGGLVGLIGAGVVAAGVAIVVGIALMRLSGIGAGIATLAFVVIVEVVLVSTKAVTGGSTLSRIPVTTTAGAAFVVAVVLIVIAFWFERSATGVRLRAARDDEVAARATGIGVFRERWIAFIISAFFFGLGGSLYVHYLGSVTVDSLYLDYTFLIITMLVVGGVGTLVGAIGGTLVVSIVNEVMTRWESGLPVGPVDLTIPVGLRQIVLAILLLAILAARPTGVFGGTRFGSPLRGLWRRDTPPGSGGMSESASEAADPECKFGRAVPASDEKG
jgi:branched-chain amino acid transport system permease protein